MRIAFPNSARDDLCWSQPVLRIGSAADNDLVVSPHQGVGHHARVQQDRRGWVLQVLPAGGRIYVNARPVRERALLRAGDILSMGDCRMLFCSDEDPARRAMLPPCHGAPCAVALRAVAGPLSGRVIPLTPSAEPGARCAVPLDLPSGRRAKLSLMWREGRLWVEAEGLPERYPLRLNGYPIEQPLALQPGDQLGVATHRFVLDAPGLVSIAPTEAPSAPPAPEEAAGPPGEVWWLIVTAAVLALGIAVALLVRF